MLFEAGTPTCLTLAPGSAVVQSYLAMVGQWQGGTFQALGSSYLSNLPPEFVQSIEPFVFLLLSGAPEGPQRLWAWQACWS